MGFPLHIREREVGRGAEVGGGLEVRVRNWEGAEQRGNMI